MINAALGAADVAPAALIDHCPIVKQPLFANAGACKEYGIPSLPMVDSERRSAVQWLCENPSGSRPTAIRGFTDTR